MSPLEWGTVCHMLVHFITNSMHINFSKSATVLQLFACSDSDFCMSIQGHMCTLYHGWWSLDYLSYPGHTLRQYLVRMRNIDADFNACAHHTWLLNFFTMRCASPAHCTAHQLIVCDNQLSCRNPMYIVCKKGQSCQELPGELGQMLVVLVYGQHWLSGTGWLYNYKFVTPSSLYGTVAFVVVYSSCLLMSL